MSEKNVSSASDTGSEPGNGTAGVTTKEWIVYDDFGDMFSREGYPDAESARYMACLDYNSWKGTTFKWRQLYNRGYRCELSTVVTYPARKGIEA